MNKTMSDCCAFWALYICLNENRQYKKEEEAQNWLDWMEELAEKEEESQRTWVGLTDEEIWQIATDSTIGGDLHADKFAKAIESKLKERNG